MALRHSTAQAIILYQSSSRRKQLIVDEDFELQDLITSSMINHPALKGQPGCRGSVLGADRKQCC